MKNEWIKKAACRGLDPNFFVPERYDVKTTKEAKKICATCPVKNECREYGLNIHRFIDLDGIFGGLTKIERLRILRKENLPRRRQSPMKDIKFRPIDMKPCGTTAAYTRHLRNNETPCPACKQAHALWQWDYRKRHPRKSRAQRVA